MDNTHTAPTMPTPTTAETVAAIFNYDGTCWEADDGASLADALESYGATMTGRQGYDERHEFEDGSVIILSEQAWDLGFPCCDDCYCWAGMEQDNHATGGHHADCLHAQTEESPALDRIQVSALRYEAGQAGDVAMVEICDRALAGDMGAWGECERVLADAAAQIDEEE